MRNFDDSFNDFLNDFLNFNDLGNDSEDLENVINIDNTHNFLVDHGNDGLIEFEDSAGSESDFLEFFKESFNEDSKVEFDSSGLGAGISVDVLNSDGLRDELDDFNDSVNLVDFDDVDDFLLEEFDDSGVELSQDSWVFSGEGLEGSGEEMDESLGSDVHDWDFNGSFGLDFDGFDSVDVVGSDIQSLEKASDLVVKIESVIRVFGSNLADLTLPDRSS